MRFNNKNKTDKAMAGITITTKLNELSVIFNKIKEVYFKKDEMTSAQLETFTIDMELPVLQEGITLNTGEAEVTEIKITTGANWTSRAVKGNPDISLQIASIAGPVNKLLMEEKKASVSATGLMDGANYKGSGFSLSPKKLTGALIFPSEDRSAFIILPKVDIYASFVAADGDNPAYFNTKVTTRENSEGVEIFILERGE